MTRCHKTLHGFVATGTADSWSAECNEDHCTKGAIL